MDRFDLVVIGGGTAGLVTASGCARLGRRVALIEKQALGGDCLWTGCVPTKALVATAKLAHQMHTAAAWGLAPHHPAIDPAAVMASMRELRRAISRHDDPERFRRLGVSVIEGEARLVSSSEIEVGDRRLTARDIVIATGSRTAVPPVEGLEEAGFVDHASFLARDEIPRSVLILGGGAIGIEFAQILRRLGSEVTVVEMMRTIVPREDRDVITRLHEILAGEGIEIYTGWAVRRVRVEGGRKLVSVERAGEAKELLVDEIFVASGRRGNIEGLGLEAAGVNVECSYVKVDRFLQSSVPRIWACGDVHGGPQFTHVAAYEAVKLVRNMLFPGRSAVDYANVPWALYTDPEAAHLGMTEAEARGELGDSVRTFCVELDDVDRAVIDRAGSGFVKLVCDKGGRLVGAHIVAPHASSLIQQLVVARKKGMRVGEIAQIVSSYPSMAEGIQKAAARRFELLASSWLGWVARKVAALSQ